MFTLYRWVNIIQHVKISSIFWTLIRFADCKWACHPSVLRDHGPVPKKLYFSCWCRHSICYGCTGPHKNDSLDSNQCMWNVTMLFPFLWACFSLAASLRFFFPHSSLRYNTCVHHEWLLATSSQLLIWDMSIVLMSFLQTSLKQRWGRSYALLPMVSSL